jgi:hypothetical protein
MAGYDRHVWVPIQPSYTQVVINGSGIAQLQLGPSGIGQRWRATYCQIATSTGANDASTCSIYLGPLAIGPLVGGQSYAGGGDSVGLPGAVMQPGDFLWALWTGGTPGAIASLAIYGDMSALEAS